MIDLKRIKTQWDLTPLLPNENPETIQSQTDEINKIAQDFENKWVNEQSTFEDPKKLKQALDELENIESNTAVDDAVGSYFGLKSSLDTADPKIKAQLTKLTDATRDSALIFQRFDNRLSKIPVDKQPLFLNDPDLAEYKKLLEESFEEGKHTLSEEAEKVLMLSSGAAYGNWKRMTSEFLNAEEVETLNDEGKKETKTFGELFTLIASKKKEVRDEAAKNINIILEKHSKVAEAEVNSILEFKKINDLLRGFEKPDSGFSMGNEVSLSVIDTLLEEVTAGNKIVHEFYKLRAKLLGLEKIKYYERTIDFGELGAKINFDDAVNTVSQTLSDLDPIYSEIFENFLYRGQIDVYPKKGKSRGAFMAPIAKNKPSYVLLNFDNRIEDTLTLAHEMGHAIHHELINRTQKSLYSSTSLCLDETASTFFESFAVDKVANSLDEEAKLTLLVKQLDDAVGSVFRQLACYKFERALHATYREKGFLPKEEIGEIFKKHMSEYCGDGVEIDPGSENWWIYWSHIRNFFYVFSYGFGYLVSKGLQSLVKQDPKNISKVTALLAAGGSLRPEDALKAVGIDINDKAFWKAGISEIRAKLDEATAIAKSLGKI